MNVLILGKNGQLARSLKDVLVPTAANLAFLGRDDADLSLPGRISSAVRDSKADVVVNTAAYTDVDGAEHQKDLAFQVNARAAGEAASAAAAIGSPFVQLSTDYVFDGKSRRPWREHDRANPLNTYGASKLAGEETVKGANPHHVIIRTSWVVSPFGRNFIRTIMNAATRRDELSVVGDQLGRLTSASDLAKAISMILERWRRDERVGLGETYHIAGSGQASWYEIALETMEQCIRVGAPAARVASISSAEWPTAAIRPIYSVLDCTKFEAQFGYRLPDWRTSVRDIVRQISTSEVE